MAQLLDQTVRDTPVSELKHHPKNPRKGDVGAIVGSIEANGFYGTVVAQVGTGYVLAGNHRLAAAKEAGLDTLPVAWVKCDAATARRILAADNRTSDLGTYDDRMLADLLSEVSNESSLEGTGYADDDLEKLIASLVPPNFEPGSEDSAPPSALAGKRVCVCPECGREFTPEKD